MSYKDMPLDTVLHKGDIVTISGPGEHDVLVREVTGFSSSGEAEVNIHTIQGVELRYFVSRDRTLTRVQRPVPALPTVEGDYILTLNNGHRMIYALRGGKWQDAVIGTHDDRQYLTACVEGGATLTRVIPADEGKRPAVSMGSVRDAFFDIWNTSGNTLGDDLEAILERVLAGEFDL